MSEWKLEKVHLKAKVEEMLDELKIYINTLDDIKKDMILRSSEDSINAEYVLFLIEKYECILYKSEEIEQFINLHYSKDIFDTEIQKFKNTIKEYTTRVLLFNGNLKLVLKNYKYNECSHMQNELSLKKYNYFIKKIQKSSEQQLSPEVEELFNSMKISCSNSFVELYNKLTCKYEFDMEVDNRNTKVSLGEIITYVRSEDREIRNKAHKSFLKRYKEDSLIIETIYNSIVKNYKIECNLRGFESPISMRNHSNEVNDEIVKNAIEIINENVSIAHRYFDWKANYTNHPLSQLDLSNQIEKFNEEYTFSDAKEIVLNAYYKLDDKIGALAETFFSENRIDSKISVGKRSGAFCLSNVPDAKPHILINYNNSLNDVLTLAHELGHGVHRTLSSLQNYFNYTPSLLISETVAVFSEMLIFDELLKNYSIEKQKLLLSNKIQNYVLPIFNTNAITMFEIKAHDLINKNCFGSFNELCDIYENEQRKLYGGYVELHGNSSAGWCSYPHIYKEPFYMYSYSFANIIALSIYNKYLLEGKNFSEKFIDFLTKGCSNSPEQLFKEFGINFEEKEFWQQAFDYISNNILTKL